MLLPFWNSELSVEISPCFPFGKDYQPVSVNRFYDLTLKEIAASCLDLEGEFFFVASPVTGCVGNLPRENFFRYGTGISFNLGFFLVLGFSEKLEKAIILSLVSSKNAQGLFAGIANCSLRSHGIFQSNAKVIVIVSDDPFYDGTEYLKELAMILHSIKRNSGASDLSYYAEKFGYDRFSIGWENENPVDLNISKIISEFNYDGTKEIVGGSSRVNMPPFLGISVAIQ